MRTRTHSIFTTLTIISAVSAAAMLNACSPGLNNATTLGSGDNAVALNTLTPDDPSLPSAIHTTQDRPSVYGADRSHWRPIAFHAPNADIQHFGQFSTSPNFVSSDHRAGGEFPTAHTALNATDTKEQRNALALEGLLAPVYAGLDVILAPIRFFVDHPSDIRTSPDTTYQRVPRTSSGLTPTLQNDRPESVDPHQ